jgi:uncharacterized protein YceK
MRISLLLIVAIVLMPLLGCGSVNKRQTPQQRSAAINKKDPLMTSNYLKRRAGQ